MNVNKTPIADNFGIIVSPTTENLDICALDRDEIINLFKSSTLLLFRGFDVDAQKFKSFTELLCTNFVAYVGGAYSRETINGDKTLLSVTGGKLKFPVPFHGEMYYKKHKPTVLWFYCQSPALQDGETTVCDGIEVYEQLSESTRELFAKKRLKYIRTYPDGGWQKIYQSDDIDGVKKVCEENDMQLIVNDDGSITTEYVCWATIKSRNNGQDIFINNILPVVEQEEKGSNISIIRFDDGSKIPEPVINELKEVTDRLTYLASWQKGDILMVDNTRLMHGRRGFADSQRDIYVRLCDAAFDF